MTVPTELSLIQSFLDSFDADSGADDLIDLRSFRRWLREHGDASVARGLDAGDLAFAREFRAALRAEVASHHSGRSTLDGAARRLDRLMARVPMCIEFGPDGPRPAPAGRGVWAFYGRMLADIARAQVGGDWERLKICPDDACAVTFHDASKNRSKKWCSMAECGNRAKTRDYRRRHGASTTSHAEHAVG